MAAIILIAMYYAQPLGMSMSIGVLITGVVCTARFLVSDHTNKEIYTGLFVGIGCQLLAYYFIM
jgi:hypothetical protein